MRAPARTMHTTADVTADVTADDTADDKAIDDVAIDDESKRRKTRTASAEQIFELLMPVVTSLMFLDYREKAEKLCRKKVAAATSILRAVYAVSPNMSLTQKDVENALQKIAQEKSLSSRRRR